MLLSIGLMISSCATVIQLGKLNMLSNRNIESKIDYVLVKNYAGGSPKEIKKSLTKDQLKEMIRQELSLSNKLGEITGAR